MRPTRMPPARIIPARAGFTLEPCDHGLHRRDHPRSRGVYKDYADKTVYGLGSSPLARGLLRSKEVHYDAERIIPARAGFTGR